MHRKDMSVIDEFERQVSSWADVDVHPHRFGGWEFRLGDAEIGHIHTGGILDIPFPRSVRDALLDEGLAEEHHWVPNSGWITYRVGGENGLQHAYWLMRLSYLRYVLKRASNAPEVFEREKQQLDLTPRFQLLLEPFIRRSRKEVPSQH